MSDSIPFTTHLRYAGHQAAKLPEETVILPDGTEKKRKIMPDADFVLDGMDMERVRELLLGE